MPQALLQWGENEVPSASWEEEKRNFLKAWAEFKGQVTDLEEESPPKRPQRPNP